jgi:hypothetical protein
MRSTKDTKTTVTRAMAMAASICVFQRIGPRYRVGIIPDEPEICVCVP